MLLVYVQRQWRRVMLGLGMAGLVAIAVAAAGETQNAKCKTRNAKRETWSVERGALKNEDCERECAHKV
jgi:hypothetical protein